MRNLSTVCLVVCQALALGAASGCSKSEAPPATTASTAAQKTAAPAAADDDRALALAPSDGNGQVDLLLRHLQASAEKNPEKADTWVLLGRAWVRKARESADPGYYAHADACARIARVREPDNALALDLSAMVLLNDHKFAEARDAAELIVDRRADDPTAYGTLSDALLELGRYEEAASAVQTMVDLKPNLPSYSRAAYVRWLAGDIQAAKQIVLHAMDAGDDTRDPEPMAWVLVQAAQMFWHEGDYEGADAGFDRALHVMPAFPPALVGKGRVALARGDAARAQSLLAQAYKASPLATTAWLLGDACARAGDAEGSATAYGHVVTEGRRTDGRTLALFLATKNRDAAEAARLAEAELRVRDDLYTEDAYGWALYRAGKLADARKAIDRATRLGTRDALLLYHAGAIRLAMGDASGRDLVARAVALNPHFDETGAVEAAGLLAR